MITVQLTRDEARAVQQYFFYYLDELCQLKYRDSQTDDDRMMQLIIIDSFQQIRKLFAKKLFNKGNKITFNFTITQAVIFYKLLSNLPLERENVYLVTLRQLIMNIIYAPIEKILAKEKMKDPAAVAS